MNPESESEMEQLLARATPLPCSVDSMQLMFDAGVEQQKLQSRHSRSRLLVASGIAAVLMFTTTMLSVWVYQLNDQNHQLLAKLELQSDPGIERTEKELPELQKAKPEAVNGSGFQVVKDATPVPQSLNKELKGSNAGSSNSFAMESGIRNVMLHGIALRPEDEYRDPLPARKAESVRGQNVSTLSNMNLMQKLQADFFAP